MTRKRYRPDAFGRRGIYNKDLTEDGLEYTFALNHISYFVLTAVLRQRLIATGAARIINTASAAHQGTTLDFDDLQSANNFRAIRTYSRSKLCNILFTRELARRLRGTEVTANCLHPGFVATRFGNESGGLLAFVTRLAKLFAISPATGAETIIYLASSPDVARVTGQYFYRSQPISPSPAAMDDQAALVLWERSAALAGIRA
jgi:NAD(P)-dependent dehydrogenase (short-subunit alcohol dehydrogenase family)